MGTKQAVGDLDYYVKWFNAPRWSQHSKPCSLCKTTFKGPLSWRDNRYNSPWQRATLTQSNYRSHWDPQGALFDIPGLSGLSLAVDWMHCHHLGWIQYLLGSVFYLLVFTMLPDSELEDLATVGKFISTFQKQNKIKNRYRMKLDKITMFQPKKGFPKLRGRAADIAGLYSAMVSIWTEYMDEDDTQHQQILLVLQLNSKIETLLATYSPSYGHFAVPPGPAEDIFNAGLQMAQLHNQLLEHYETTDLKLFNMTSKTHFALHSLQFCKYVHPYLVWAYHAQSTGVVEILLTWFQTLAGVQEGCSQRETPALAAGQAGMIT